MGNQIQENIMFVFFNYYFKNMLHQEIPNLLSESVRGDDATVSKLSEEIKSFKSQTVTETSEIVASEVSHML